MEGGSMRWNLEPLETPSKPRFNPRVEAVEGEKRFQKHFEKKRSKKGIKKIRS